MAAFLPKGDLRRLKSVPVYWGHGERDDRVPVWRARREVRQLRSLGASVEYCEADVGHKLGVECLRGLEVWLEDLGRRP